MAELAKTYHDNLQNQGQEERNPILRDQTIQSTLENIETEPHDTDIQMMNSLITEEEVVAALKLSDNDKAAGLDGATHEMWNSMTQEQEPHRTEEAPFNVITPHDCHI